MSLQFNNRRVDRESLWGPMRAQQHRIRVASGSGRFTRTPHPLGIVAVPLKGWGYGGQYAPRP